MQDTAPATQDSTKRVGKSPTINVPLNQRAAYTPNEFAALFGREGTWGYRQLYRGRVREIRSMGRIMIPRSEVDRLQRELATHGEIAEQRTRSRNLP